jgi:tetratricopeptide (TPR) repeat protein
MTCHRGVPDPRPLDELLSQTMLDKGEGAAVSLYKDLRQKYEGAGPYDFGEAVLVGLARQSLATRKPDDALAWLQLNVEFYPKSVASFLLLSEVHQAKGDRDQAAADLQKALEIDPQSAQAKRQLRALRN